MIGYNTLGTYDLRQDADFKILLDAIEERVFNFVKMRMGRDSLGLFFIVGGATVKWGCTPSSKFQEFWRKSGHH